ncbi:CdaR family transcriptional regulator [Ectobacillus ponti]|uniref:Helix-turn-helix domain-containing protein n=1 Tax=Ectobacillus ponti TaxID=2961894 RepID=A0AA41X118_9BACI|nr:sugar diacid recognition domain-containing protein [Ectobacillus ponti]MCP8966996.1 helix-turn-helix domain-containing protein [Ectobacillus ponti]
MLLSSHHAQRIVEDMYHIANYNLIFANEEGIIIASVDQSRIGDLHEGALEVLRTKRKVVIEHDGQYRGALTGITYPLFLYKRIVGVIGITGAEAEVGKIGEVVKRVVEMLVKEVYTERQRELEYTARESFVQDWLLQEQEDEQLCASRGLLLGIDVSLPRAAGIFEVIHNGSVFLAEPGGLQKQHSKSSIVKRVKELLPNAESDVIVPIGGSRYVVLFAVPDMTEWERKDYISGSILSLKEWLENELGSAVAAGVGQCGQGVAGVKQSYWEGEKAVYFSKKRTGSPATFYHDLRLERLIYDLQPASRKEYVRSILQLDRLPDPQQALETLRLLFKHNHSITEVAQELHIHKNTVQYRLNKIRDLTGFDPRTFEDAAVLHLAVVLHSLEEEDRP